MTQNFDDLDQPWRAFRLREPKIGFWTLIVLILALAAGGSALVLHFSALEEARALLNWQNKLNLIADSRAAEIDRWVESRIKDLQAVANNPSLQLYLADLQTAAAQSPSTEEPAQRVFLRNLLLVTADRMGLAEDSPDEKDEIPAAVRRPSGTGLAILAPDDKVIVATSGLSTLDATLLDKLAQAVKDHQPLIDLYTSEDGALRLGFTLPLYAVQSEPKAGTEVGRLLAVAAIDGRFFRLLRHPGVTEDSLESQLLRQDDSAVTFLSAGAGHLPLSARFALNTPELDAAFAVRDPGSFAQKRNSAFQPVLLTSRHLTDAPWTLMTRVRRDEALAESDAWRLQASGVMFFGLLAALGGIVAVWYYGTSRRARLLSIETSRMAGRLAAQEKLLRVVADHQLEAVMLVDRQTVAHFANAQASAALHLTPADVVGKDLAALLGPAQAQAYIEANEQAAETGQPVLRTWTREDDKVLRSAHIPLPHIPIDRLPVPTPGFLMIDQDVTEIVNERERRLGLSQQIIGALVDMVDRRDPYAAHHSAAVALVAREAAYDMGLDPLLIETAEVAGKLMNIGKIVVPPEILTKTSPLAQDEKALVADTFRRSAEVLHGISFEGPVVETLRQAQERFDGTGPQKRGGEDILVTARIISASNAFVGMISARAYRANLGMDEAIKNLLSDADKAYDRRVVVTVAHFIENRQGKSSLEAIVRKMKS